MYVLILQSLTNEIWTMKNLICSFIIFLFSLNCTQSEHLDKFFSITPSFIYSKRKTQKYNVELKCQNLDAINETIYLEEIWIAIGDNNQKEFWVVLNPKTISTGENYYLICSAIFLKNIQSK